MKNIQKIMEIQPIACILFLILARISLTVPSVFSSEIKSVPTGTSKIKILPSALVTSSWMEQYIYHDPFFWHINVGGVKSIEYNEEANTISFGLSGIQRDYKDRNLLYLIISGLNIKSVKMREGHVDQGKTLRSACIKSPYGEEGIMYKAFDCGEVSWNKERFFTVYLYSRDSERFSITIIAQEPSKINIFLEEVGEVLFSSILTLLRLQGYSNTWATTFARYECSFSPTLDEVSEIVSAEKIKLLILKPLVDAIKNFRY